MPNDRISTIINGLYRSMKGHGWLKNNPFALEFTQHYSGCGENIRPRSMIFGRKSQRFIVLNAAGQ